MSEIKYAEGYTAIVRPVTRYGCLVSGQNVTGYGSKISTDYMVHFPNDPSNRYYRVYLIQYSNRGSLYITRKGENLYLREIDLEIALGR